MALRVFQPTLPARGATLFQHIGQCRQPCISTHAPRTGSDRAASPEKTFAGTISTHAPRTGSDKPAFAADATGN